MKPIKAALLAFIIVLLSSLVLMKLSLVAQRLHEILYGRNGSAAYTTKIGDV